MCGRLTEDYASCSVMEGVQRGSLNAGGRGWQTPGSGWLKANVDGAILLRSGGLRDEHGEWIFGFSKSTDQQWDIVINHISRKANGVADGLARLSRGAPVGIVYFQEPPLLLAEALAFSYRFV
ncbi:hypothetical protein V6N11_067190 [Hibiscus sabdariffa]|uniref:RNase H type-1 domain-containing protein n=1 Tax=Hibiscus sabdariffa TaxID=183260 RepID=A0ABR2SQY5_9ROSI